MTHKLSPSSIYFFKEYVVSIFNISIAVLEFLDVLFNSFGKHNYLGNLPYIGNFDSAFVIILS
jgi:hypothetical protein